jgi:2-dehydro-3-deoxy-D-gluconate 5-dehydrogenase
MKLFDLSGRVALVTGGNGGIGLGIATGLAQAGAAIAIAGRRALKNQDAVRKLTELGATAIDVEIDVANESSCREAIHRVGQELGRLDILVNNAGVANRKPPEAYTLAEWQEIINVNLTGAFVCSQAAYPYLKSSGHGKIINIGSMLSIFGVPFAVAYAASKGGIVQMTKALATAWAKDNIQCNSILPGWINTDLTAAARQQVEGLNERVLSRTPAQRWGEPADFAGVAVFLASSGSDFVTGTAIPVDGGYSVQG